MTTQKEILAASEEVHAFLAGKTDRHGKIALNQKELAAEYGLSHVRFHRLIQRLITDERLRVIGRGARGALTVVVVGKEPESAESHEVTSTAVKSPEHRSSSPQRPALLNN